VCNDAFVSDDEDCFWAIAHFCLEACSLIKNLIVVFFLGLVGKVMM
jgi:hypothetical protein